MPEAAILEFLSLFPSLAENPPTALIDLDDGFVLTQALNEIAPIYFDTGTLNSDTGSNWALKVSNLRKLTHNLKRYLAQEFKKQSDVLDSLDVTLIAKFADLDEITSLFSVIAFAAVQCENRAEFVSRIMNMDNDNQVEMKELLENALHYMKDADEGGNGMDLDEKEISFNDEGSDNEMFDKINDLEGEMAEATALLDERDELREQLELAKKEIENLKGSIAGGAGSMEDELESQNRKLQEYAEDLQDRLEERTNELTQKEQESISSKRMNDELSSELQDLKQKFEAMADELNVAQSQANQLRKTEAALNMYKKKIENVGGLNQQMQELEEQSANYLRQIIDLENANKSIPALKKKNEEYSTEMLKLQSQLDENLSTQQNKDAEFKAVLFKLDSAEKSKKMLEDELAALRAEQEVSSTVMMDESVDGLNLSTKNVNELNEKVIRLEYENRLMKEKIDPNGDSLVNSEEVERLKTTVAGLTTQLKEEQERSKKISSDKDKLEAYTKKTLHKFQEKYLVALQECKTKLKDKHEKIEALEARQAAERSAQKREERLLSSTIYELGLAIMQNKLAKR